MSQPRRPFYRRRRFWFRLILGLVLLPLVAASTALAILVNHQDQFVQEVVTRANQDFAGKLSLEDSHIEPFSNFPYVSIDLEGLRVYESKDTTCDPLVHVQDAYLGFDLWDVIAGKMEIREVKLKGGAIHLVQHVDGTFNVQNALMMQEEAPDTALSEEAFHLDLREIIVEEVDINKLNESANLLVDTYVQRAKARFKTTGHDTHVSLDAQFMLSLVQGGDTTFIKHKHFDLSTQLDYLDSTQVLRISPTVAKLEGSTFQLEGMVDFDQDMWLDLHFSGHKPDFQLFFAMAPEEMAPILANYENKGDITFDAWIQGASANGHQPRVEASFACKDARIDNRAVHKHVEGMGFRGHFTTGDECNASTMELTVSDFSARPEAGTFSGDLHVRNFDSPDIDLRLNSKFNLDFLAKFFRLNQLQGLDGEVELTMNFHDIIDLSRPERSIEKLNESYFTQLRVEGLTFSSAVYALPIDRVDLYAEVTGHTLRLDYCNIKAGSSDISIQGSLSDLPAVLHHTDQPVDARLAISSQLLDLFELTGSDSAKSMQERVHGLRLEVDLKTSARAVTESPHLPTGEFLVENLYAKLDHYPHTLHDFHADLFLEPTSIRIVDFTGQIDQSDFHFSGALGNYPLLMQKHPHGEVSVDVSLVSNRLQLHDLFSYKGENYVPVDWRHEELDQVKVHGTADLHFRDSLAGVDARMDRVEGKAKVHHLRMEQFKGRVHYEDQHLVVEDFSGRMGHSDFKTTLHWYLGRDEATRKRDNYFKLTSSHLDVDELMQYNLPSSPAGSAPPTDHDAGFNLYALPFTDMRYEAQVGLLNYHKVTLQQVNASLRTTRDHFLHIDKLTLQAAGGTFDIKGQFDGSDSTRIHFSPDISFAHVDLDRLMVKFDNFGQDHLVSENLHGQVSGTLRGKLHMHKDLVPKLDDSELQMDVQVVNGRLENYALLESMGEYFEDKNMRMVRFDTLANEFTYKNGTLLIPSMTINSSLGFMQISGQQDMDLNMEYYIRVPWKMVTQSASSKLFGKKAEEVDPEQEDAIQFADPEKRIRYLNLKVTGTPEDYKITLGRDKPARGTSKGAASQ